MADEIHVYFCKHHELQTWEHEALDFQTYNQVLQKIKKKLATRIKLINQQWNTMEVCLQWKTAMNAQCPLCSAPVETWRHVFSCPCSDIQRVHFENIKKWQKNGCT